MAIAKGGGLDRRLEMNVMASFAINDYLQGKSRLHFPGNLPVRMVESVNQE